VTSEYLQYVHIIPATENMEPRRNIRRRFYNGAEKRKNNPPPGGGGRAPPTAPRHFTETM
jgi:hypothetical protein